MALVVGLGELDGAVVSVTNTDGVSVELALLCAGVVDSVGIAGMVGIASSDVDVAELLVEGMVSDDDCASILEEVWTLDNVA